jgi:putative DNA primase/helicase
MQPLPHPVPGGNIEELRPFLNLEEEKDWVLVVGWLLGTLHPTGPYTFLTLYGEKGSAKTSTTRNLRGLVDPSVAPVPVQPKDSEALTLKAHHNYVVAFDNMSSLPRWLSDGLCRLSTGAGDTKRQLYENTDEIIFSAKRPCIINGIEELATAGDLLECVFRRNRPLIPRNPVHAVRKVATTWGHDTSLVMFM